MDNNVSNSLPYSERPTPEQQEVLNRIDIADILDEVGVAYELNDAETEHGFADWYASSDDKCVRQWGVVWETGVRSLIVVTVFFWNPYVTIRLRELDKTSGRCRASAACVDVSISREAAAAFAAKLRSVAA